MRWMVAASSLALCAALGCKQPSRQTSLAPRPAPAGTLRPGEVHLLKRAPPPGTRLLKEERFSFSFAAAGIVGRSLSRQLVTILATAGPQASRLRVEYLENLDIEKHEGPEVHKVSPVSGKTYLASITGEKVTVTDGYGDPVRLQEQTIVATDWQPDEDILPDRPLVIGETIQASREAMRRMAKKLNAEIRIEQLTYVLKEVTGRRHARFDVATRMILTLADKVEISIEGQGTESYDTTTAWSEGMHLRCGFHLNKGEVTLPIEGAMEISSRTTYQ